LNIIVKDENGLTYHLIEKIGSGGQGAVFKVRDNDAVVVKVLFDHDNDRIICDEQIYESYKAKIREIISLGEFKHLAVPLVMLEKPTCGYVMLFMTGLQPISGLMLPYVWKDKAGNIIKDRMNRDKKNRTLAKSKDESVFSYNESGGIEKRLKCLARLARILGSLSNKGVVYCDLSPSNIYISRDVTSHEVWLIDLDNLRLSSDSRKAIGTPKFMAPEVVKGSSNTIESDTYSFALIAYQLLTYSEPFNGKMIDDYDSWEKDNSEDQAFDKAIAQGEVPWIWEVNDDRNRSNKGFDPHVLLNPDIFMLFEWTLNAEGRLNPRKRPTVWEWHKALTIAHESLMLGEVGYADECFREYIETKKSKYMQKVFFLNQSNPFIEEKKVRRYKVSISKIVLLEDEEGNRELIAIPDVTLYWSMSDKVDTYQLSNLDLSILKRGDYIPNYVSFVRKEQLYLTSKEYRIVTFNNDVEVLVVDGEKVKSKIDDLTKSIIYVKYKGDLSNKIKIEVS